MKLRMSHGPEEVFSVTPAIDALVAMDYVFLPREVLSVEDVHLSFGGVKALQGVGFNVHRGEIFSIIGPNGAGKTSMINVISGFYKPTSGRISYEGKDRTNLSPEAVARLGFARTFQNFPHIDFHSAPDAKSGIAMAHKEKPQVILLDLRMPGIGGEEALVQLKHELPETKFMLSNGKYFLK